MLPSSDIELWIKAVHNSGEIDENKWELIKLLNKMHIFSLADEYEKEDKLKEEADKNWLEPKGENKITNSLKKSKEGLFNQNTDRPKEDTINYNYVQNENSSETLQSEQYIISNVSKTLDSLKQIEYLFKNNENKSTETFAEQMQDPLNKLTNSINIFTTNKDKINSLISTGQFDPKDVILIREIMNEMNKKSGIISAKDI